MKTPRFFLGSIVLFWGFQVQLLWIAAILAAILESARIIKSKFEFKPDDFNKFVDITTVLLAGTVVIFLSTDAKKAGLNILKWLPCIVFPIIAAQELSNKGKIDTRSFFLATRKRAGIQFHVENKIDISYPYSLLCLFSAGSANIRGDLFYCSIVFFAIWALWQIRSKHMASLVWAGCILIVLASGYAGHRNILKLSGKFTHWMMSYYSSYRVNPFKTYTAMGDMGELKLSGKIILRVQPDNYTPGKTWLLHNATYYRFAASNWFADMTFEPVAGETGKDDSFWRITPPASDTDKMTIYSRPPRQKRAVLTLPPGLVSISEMKVGSCSKNSTQTIRSKNLPALLKAVVEYSGRYSYDPPPLARDLLIPKNELPGIKKITEDLELDDKSPKEILKTIRLYFLNNYTYSLVLKGKGKLETPLQNFLRNTHAGHCEFFATATTLILRQAQIPARYATGLIAHEYSPMEKQILVRQRDAHAWVKVYIDDQWINFDTTPPAFLEEDSRMAGLSPVSDFFSFLGFELSKLRHETGTALMEKYGLWLTLPLGLILFARLRRTGNIKRVRGTKKAANEKNKKIQSLSLYSFEQILTEKGYPRHPYETRLSWINRIGHGFDSHRTDIGSEIRSLLIFQDIDRFSRDGLPGDEKKEFESAIARVLKKIATRKNLQRN